MDIVIGRGNSRQKVTFASGEPMRRMEREKPIEYVEARGSFMALIRQQQGEGK